MPHTSTEVTPRSRSQSASTTPPVVRPSNPEYAAWCSPLRKIASNGCGSRLGWKASPSVPTLQCTGQVSTKSGFFDQWPPGSMWWSLVATTTSYAGALGSCRVQWWSSVAMSLATWAPPVTGSDPPSQKSFCTSTTMSACFMGGGYSSATRLVRTGSVPLEAGLDDRVALGELTGHQRKLTARALVSLPRGRERFAPDHLAVAHQRHQHRPVVTVVLH